MDATLLLALLKQTKNQPFIFPQELEHMARNSSKVKTFLKELAAQGFSFAPTIDGNFRIEHEERVRLVILGVKNGLDFDLLVKHLTWQEFELLVTIFGDEAGYSATTGLNFSTGKRKYQIDVVLKNNPYVFLIDCKHFGGTGKKAQLRAAAEAQRARCVAVRQHFLTLKTKLAIGSWQKVVLLPMLVTWLDDEIRFYEHVPIVPIAKLRSFFMNFYEFYEDLFRLEMTP
ncbi:MAG: hypothetical protein ACTSXO_07615 [Candidatus Heimdallarchaeota archaeon]